MNKSRVMPGLVLAALAWMAAPQAWSAEGEAPKGEDLETWVKNLGSEDFAKRVEAEKKLVAAGEAAQPALEKAAASEDLEVKSRASRLLLTLKTEPVLQKMADAMAKAKSYESDMKMSMAMMGMQTEMSGHFKGLADGSKMIMDMTMSIMGQNMKMHMVSDGTTMWTETELPGGQGKMIQKMSVATMQKMAGQKAGGQNPMDSARQMREQFDFTELAEGTVDERPMYILTGKIKPGIIEQQAKTAGELGGEQAAAMAKAQMQGFDKSIMYLDKETLFLRKSEVLDAQGQKIMSMELTNTKLNVELDEAAFSYTPPEGAQVMDVDAMLQQARAAQEGGAGDGGDTGNGDDME